MPFILNIETSTTVCSVALSANGNVIFSKETYEGMSHASVLGVFVEEAMSFIRKNGQSLDAVAVSCGPGSYTGLRIGVSTAKGLCYGLNIPLIAVPTLLVLTEAAKKNSQFIEKETLFCPMIDARRMEVYTALYDNNLQVIKETSAEIITENSFSDILKNYKIIFFGDGAEKCKQLITHSNATFLENINPLAKNMLPLSEQAFYQNNFEDVAYFEPFYLKDFIATTPKNRI